MKWQDLRRSENVEDRRGMPVSGRTMAMGGGGIGVLVIVLLVALMGGDPSQVLQQLPQGPTTGELRQPGDDPRLTAEQQVAADFVSAVLGSTEDIWKSEFAKMGRTYEPPVLVLFAGRVESACGFASAASGPFYCPPDRKVYIDLTFFNDMKKQLNAPGDFAQAYVIAHEIGHHVQNLLGTAERVHAARSRLSETEYNQLSVRMELQADFLAGLWAHHAQKQFKILEPGDIEEALNAANAIGDDRLQKQSQGYVVPDAFTHGTSEQRVRWFRKGFDTGDISRGDTFNSPDL